MEILIIGAGCPKCQAVEKVVKEVVEELKIAANISHVYDIREFPKYKIKITPAVVIDGKVVLSGKIPSKKELIQLLKK